MKKATVLPRAPGDVAPVPAVAAALAEAAPLTVLRAAVVLRYPPAVAGWARATAPDDVVWLTAADGAPLAQLADLLDVPATTGAVAGALLDHGAVTVVVDDLDAAAPSTDADLLTLVRRVPGLRLVVMCQERRPIEARGTVEADAVVVTAEDLALDGEAVRGLFAARGLRLSDAEVADILADTQGRPDLVRAGLVHARRRDGGAGIDWSGAEAFLQQRWAEVRAPHGRALDLTAVVGLEPAVVAAALGVDHARAQEVVAELVRTGFATTRRPARRPVLVSVLTRIIQRDHDPAHPEMIAAHGRLADLARDRGLADRALDHALEARRWRFAAETVDADLIPLLLNHAALVGRAVTLIPPEVMAEFPAPLAAVRLLRGSPVPAELLTGGDPRMAFLTRIGEMTRARFAGQLDLAAELGRELSALVPPSAEVGRPRSDIAVVRAQIAVSLFLVGDLAGAVRESDLALAVADGLDLPAQSALGTKAVVAALLGTGPQVQALLDRSAVIPVGTGGMWQRTMVWADCARALTAVGALDLAGAERALERLEDIAPDEELWAVVAFVRALASMFTDPHGGLTELRRTWGEQSARSPAGSLAQELLQAVELTLLHATGEGTRAARLLRAEDDPGRVAGLLDGRAARVVLALGRPEEARRRAVRWSTVPESVPWGQVVSATVEAVAAHRMGLHTEAGAALAAAVAAAQDSRILLPFVTVPWEELSEIADRSGNVAARDLLDSEPVRAYRDVLPAALDHIELTEREMVVLRQLAVEASQERIAAALFVSQNTVKTQIRGIYRKLGAANREQALTAASRAGLLDGVGAEPGR